MQILSSWTTKANRYQFTQKGASILTTPWTDALFPYKKNK